MSTEAETGAETEAGVVVRCARHPSVETTLRCGRCNTPICPRCLVATPVGARCPTCARVRRVVLMVKPAELARAAGAGLAVAALGSLLVGFVMRLGLGLFALAFLGFAVGEAVSVAANRKRAPELGPLAIACLVLGYALGPLLGLLLSGNAAAVLAAPALVLGGLLAIFFTPAVLIGMLVGALLAWMRVR